MEEWLEKRVPFGFWDDERNVKNYIRWLFKKLNLKYPSGLYEITNTVLSKNYGSSLLKKYGNVQNLTKSLFPNSNWYPWLFKNTPASFWKDRQNCIDYLEWLGKKLKFKKSSDWYRITYDKIQNNGGAGILLNNKGSASVVVMKYLDPPSVEGWLPWKFKPVPRNWWSKKQNRLAYLEWFKKEMGIRNELDWYYIKYDDFRKLYGGGLVANYGGTVYEFLRKHITYDFEKAFFIDNKATQRELYIIVKSLLPKFTVHWDYKHGNIRFSKTNVKMESDIYVPSLNLSIEYQGEQHVGVRYRKNTRTDFEKIKARDKEKAKAFTKNGIKQVNFDTSWDGSIQDVIKRLKSFPISKNINDVEKRIKRQKVILSKQTDKYLFLDEAKRAVKKLKIKTRSEYLDRYREDSRLPQKPEKNYANDGWVDYYDFLGQMKKLLVHYTEAQEQARSIGIKTSSEWRTAYKAGKLNQVPQDPENYYKNKGWISWAEFLDTKNIATQKKVFISYEQAKKIVERYKLKSQKEYYQFVRELPDEDLTSLGVPKKPSDVYKEKGWISWGDYLGAGNKYQYHDLMSFKEAKKFVKLFNFTSQGQWFEYARGKTSLKPTRPGNLPIHVQLVYKAKGWKGWKDFLGY